MLASLVVLAVAIPAVAVGGQMVFVHHIYRKRHNQSRKENHNQDKSGFVATACHSYSKIGLYHDLKYRNMDRLAPWFSLSPGRVATQTLLNQRDLPLHEVEQPIHPLVIGRLH